MPVHRTYQPSDIEKRLKLLTQQLYGKNKPVRNSTRKLISDQEVTSPGPIAHTTADLTFLKQDLTKIVILASLAIGAQFILYFSQLPSKIKLF